MNKKNFYDLIDVDVISFSLMIQYPYLIMISSFNQNRQPIAQLLREFETRNEWSERTNLVTDLTRFELVSI